MRQTTTSLLPLLLSPAMHALRKGIRGVSLCAKRFYVHAEFKEGEENAYFPA
jgi:uncharacterized membrane-anchored protein